MGFRKGTGFTNLNRVMTANQGNRLGSTVSSGISGQAQGVQAGVQKSQEEFDKEAQKNRLDTEENKQKRDETIAQAGVQPIGSTQPLNSAQPSQQQITDFSKYRTGTYTGPKELANTQSLYGQAQQAEQLGSLAKSGGGRQELLRRFVGGDNYTQGQKTLDESLLGQDRTNQLSGAARQTRGAVDKVSQANQVAGSQAQEYINRAKDFGQETMTKLGEAQAPVNEALNARLSEQQAQETGRLSNYNTLTNLFAGKDIYKNLDRTTRVGQGINEALNAGILTQDQANKLLSDRGLISRAEKLKLDTGKLLGERFKSQIAQNINRSGSVSEEEAARMNALEKLAGKVGTDVEFERQSPGKYAEGQTSFDMASLEKYISDTEKEKARNDAAYAAKLAAEEAKYMNQLKASAGQYMGGAQQVLAGQMQLGEGLLSGNVGDSVAGATQIGQGGTDALSGQVGMVDNSQNAMLEGLMKLNVGGKSFAKTAAGKEALKLLQQKNNLVNNQRMAGQELSSDLQGGLNKIGSGNVMGGLSDLHQAPIDAAKGQVDNLKRSEAGKIAEKFAQPQIDIAKNITSGYGKDVANKIEATRALTEDLAKGDISASTKKMLKYIPKAELQALAKQYKNIPGASSLNKAISKTLSGAVSKLTGGVGKGFKISDENQKTDIDYNPKDVDNFLSRLKPASYDYKEEVKNDPRASKDRQLGVMAQDLEKSKLGKEAVHEEDIGKVVDYKDLQPKMLASLAALHQRLKKLEGGE